MCYYFSVVVMEKFVNIATLFVMSRRRIGSRAYGFRNPVWRCSVAAAAFSQKGSGRECAGVWVLAHIPRQMTNQVKLQTLFFLLLNLIQKIWKILLLWCAILYIHAVSNRIRWVCMLLSECVSLVHCCSLSSGTKNSGSAFRFNQIQLCTLCGTSFPAY